MAFLQEAERHLDLKRSLGICVMALLAMSIGVTVLAGNRRIVEGVTVGKIPVGKMSVSQAAAVLKNQLVPTLSRRIALNYQKKTVHLSLAAIGIQPDYQATAEKAYRIGRTGPIWRQVMIRWQTKRRGCQIPLQFKNNRQTWLSFYRLLEATHAVEPVRSHVTVSRAGKIDYTRSKNGLVIEASVLLKRLEAAVDPEITNVDIPVKTEIPPLTEAEIQSWSLNQLLGFYDTPFDPTSTDRVHNIQIACGAFDNTLVYPGQKFSFNLWVGPRVSEAGYRDAPVIFMGKLVAGVGGGVCQVSSTLYNAVLLANLKVIERHNHSLPSSYVPLARDATLVDGGMDFVFENTNRKPVLVTARIEDSHVIVAILGGGKEWEKVDLETVVIKTFPVWIKEIPDPTLLIGSRVKAQDGKPGFNAELWRTITMKDGLIRRMKVNTSIYPAQPEEYKVGTKQPAEF